LRAVRRLAVRFRVSLSFSVHGLPPRAHVRSCVQESAARCTPRGKDRLGHVRLESAQDYRRRDQYVQAVAPVRRLAGRASVMFLAG
jgi:hypothetical protein